MSLALTTTLAIGPHLTLIALRINLYGSRIFNVHIKDRGEIRLYCTSWWVMPIFHWFFVLRDVDYSGNFIFQTARAVDSDHLGVLRLYKEQVIAWSN